MVDDPIRHADDPIRYWDALTTTEVASLADDDAVVVLPLAATEQHGPHLPLSTDLDIAMGLCRRAFEVLPSGYPVRLLPPMAVGASEEHRDLPGTLSIDAELMERMIRRRGSDVARSGIRRLVLFNSHGGNRSAMESAGLALRRSERMLVVKADYFRFPRPDDPGLTDEELRRGIHGGAVETAMMLHLRPERVRVERIADFPSLDAELEAHLERLTAGGSMAFSWLARDLHDSGAVGDARAATAELGKRLVTHYGDILADLVRDARDFPLERLR